MQPLTKSPRGHRNPPSDDIEKQMIQAVPVAQPLTSNQPTRYPLFSAHIAADETSQIYRRFLTLRTRLLLYKQDSLSVLESKLDKIDRGEKCKVFLGSRRRDRNQERHNVLLQIEAELAGYDELVERSARVYRFTQAQRRDVNGLRKWVDGNGCIAREESRYLAHGEDLFTFSLEDQDPLSRLERSVEDALIPFLRSYYKKQASEDTPPDANASLFLAKRAARASMAAIVTTVLLLPMLVCKFLPSLTTRVAITAISVMVLVAMISGFIKARSIEILAASMIYATVMMVLATDGS